MVRVGVSAWSWRSLDECTEAVPVLVCHDEVVVECEAEQAAEVKTWLEKAMIEGMDAVMKSAGGARVPVEVAARIAKNWGGRG
jgi:DNA polymerase I-like protein with 3'-5' exonuclease and polymerase domains